MLPIQKFFKGFVYAFAGVVAGFSERNMRVHGIAAVIVVILAWYYRVSATEWLIILLLIGAVWSAELVNTALEDVCNLMKETNKLAYAATQRARDVAAGSVLVLAVVAALAAGIIFLPKL